MLITYLLILIYGIRYVTIRGHDIIKHYECVLSVLRSEFIIFHVHEPSAVQLTEDKSSLQKRS